MTLIFAYGSQITCFLAVLVNAYSQDWITHNNHYYYFSSTSDNPDSENARMKCISFGANLLSIADQEEQNFIDMNVNIGYIIGLRTNSSGEAVMERKNWFWLDGTEYDVDVFHNWEVAKPDSGFEKCGRLFNTGEWRNAGCDGKYQYICKKKDPCATGTMQCINGDCTVIHNETKYQCDCYAGYTGSKCETDIDECRSNPCVNGECEDEVNGYSCECANSGYEGDYCEIDIDECAAGALQCYNGGKCKNTDGSAYCECVPGTTGKQCETDIDACLSSPCNNGTCTDQLNGYECRCFDGYEGVHCQNDINECAVGTLKCEYNSTCVNTPGSAHCDCINGTTGERCETNIDECSEQLRECVNGTCYNFNGSYNCSCMDGYVGEFCEFRNDTVHEIDNNDNEALTIAFYTSLGICIAINSGFLSMVIYYYVTDCKMKKAANAMQFSNLQSAKRTDEEGPIVAENEAACSTSSQGERNEM